MPRLATTVNIIPRSDLSVRGTGVRGLTRSLATPLPQDYQEPLVVTDKAVRPPGEVRVIKSVECDILSLWCSDIVGWVTGRASGL